MKFRFFNPDAQLEISHGNLPHWEQSATYYFITWRTADSIPVEILERWLADRAAWLRQHGIDPARDDWQRELELLPREKHREFYRAFTAKWHDDLDECYGACVLRQPHLARIVAENLHHLDRARYELAAFAVMPNHVHVLVGIEARGEMRKLCRNWKKYTATEINKRLGVSGQFWQWESYDHLVRSEGSFNKFRDYIVQNPVKAKLRTGEYVVYVK